MEKKGKIVKRTIIKRVYNGFKPDEPIEVPDSTAKLNNAAKLKTIIGKKQRFEARTGVESTASYLNVIPKIFKKPFKLKTRVHFDLTIIISSFNRYEKLNRILKQLTEQPTKYTFKIIIYNDGSNDKRYDNLIMKYPNIKYLKGTINNGKGGYWISMNKLFQCTSQYETHAVCQIDDDYYLCENFIDGVMGEFFMMKDADNRFVSVYYHRTTLEIQEKIDNHRIDGGVLFDFYFLEHLNFRINEPNSHLKNNVSSGVWNHLTRMIINAACFSHRPIISYVKHDGNDDSKMHKEHRDFSPINSVSFKNDIKND